jgi:hypothetical protein
MKKLSDNLYIFMQRVLMLFFIFLLSPSILLAIEDEITFFNVGQGHCTLIRRVGYVPLLIDAGSKQKVERVKSNCPDYEGSASGKKVISNIVNKIIVITQPRLRQYESLPLR